jgi:type IV pilus assembly protein PilA
VRYGKRRNGFSLLELLVVVAVILIVSAIALPNLLRSKLSANEASAVGSLRAINAACSNYSSNWGKGFPVSLSNLGPGKPATATSADLIDSLLAAGSKSGYSFIYVSGNPASGKIGTYTVQANPLVPQKTGGRYFFTDDTGVIRYNLGAAATVSSKPIS